MATVNANHLMVDGSDFRKKPVIVQAYQTDEEMITEVNGEQYPCKPDIFEKTYEPVNEDEITDQVILNKLPI